MNDQEKLRKIAERVSMRFPELELSEIESVVMADLAVAPLPRRDASPASGDRGGVRP